MAWPCSARAVTKEVWTQAVNEDDVSRDKVRGAHRISWDKSISSKAKLHSKAEESDLYYCCSGAGGKEEADMHRREDFRLGLFSCRQTANVISCPHPLASGLWVEEEWEWELVALRNSNWWLRKKRKSQTGLYLSKQACRSWKMLRFATDALKGSEEGYTYLHFGIFPRSFSKILLQNERIDFHKDGDIQHLDSTFLSLRCRWHTELWESSVFLKPHSLRIF